MSSPSGLGFSLAKLSGKGVDDQVEKLSSVVDASLLFQTTVVISRPSRPRISSNLSLVSEPTKASFVSEFSRKFFSVAISPCGSSGTQTAPRYRIARYANAQEGWFS